MPACLYLPFPLPDCSCCCPALLTSPLSLPPAHHHPQVQVNFGFGGRAASRSTSLGGSEAAATAAVAGAPAAHGQELASPPPADALEAMEALVAAAGFAGTHGTPAIQAALAGAAGAATAAAIAASGIPRADGLPQYKRRRVGQDETGDFMEQQEQQVLMARRADGALGLGWPAPAAAPSASLADWQPTAVHTLMLRAINQVLEGHEWSAAEQADCLRFRWARWRRCERSGCGVLL